MAGDAGVVRIEPPASAYFHLAVPLQNSVHHGAFPKVDALMHGCTKLWLILFPVLMAGCAETPEPERGQPYPPREIVGEAFNESTTGTLYGTVTWHGDLPEAAPFKVLGLPSNYPIDVRQDQPNPNLPRIQPATLAVENVVVFLREVDVKRSRPWDHPKVRIEQRDRRLLIRQGETSANVGWARAGDMIEITNQDDHFHMLRGGGADFFSLPFPQPQMPSRRRLDKRGLVELSSGAFFFWMRGYVFVDDHPYYARTDARGSFELGKIPAGSYELVCWLPNWRVARKSRDPETGLIVRVEFEPPLLQTRKVLISPGERQEQSFAWSSPDVAK
jgi:hypothetical protein